MSKTVEKTVLPSPDKLPKDHLRKVEKDVLIAKKLRTLGMQLCEEYVQAFSECAKGRTLSMVWRCRKESAQMQDCLKGKFTDPELFERCKQEYLQEREEFRQTGIRKKMKRVSS